MGCQQIPGTQALTPPAPTGTSEMLDAKDVQMLQDAISKMDPTVSNHTPKPTWSGSVFPTSSSPC